MRTNFKTHIAVIIALCLAGATVSAQQVSKSDPEVGFNSHWYLQLRGGAAYTLGEGDYGTFGDLVSGSANIYAGYQFSPVWGLRFGLEGWQGKGGWAAPETIYKFNFLQGNVDMTVDLSNWWGGYRHDRFFDAYFFIGPGVNAAFNNDEACELNDKGYTLGNLWRDNKISIAGHSGLGANLRLSDHVAINLEVGANMLTDKFNSKKAGNPDWLFTAAAGLTFSFGKTYKRTVKSVPEEVYVVPAPKDETEPAIEEPIVEEVAEEPVEVAPANMTENIFFLINSAKIEESEQGKIASLASFLNEHPSAEVEICGYSDAATGNAALIQRISMQRDEAVAESLKAGGIGSERISIDYKGDKVQPFDKDEMNRVAICIAD